MDISELYILSILGSGKSAAIRSIFDSIPHGIFITDRERKIVFANRVFREWHPHLEEKAPLPCYRVIQSGSGDAPCADCPLDNRGPSPTAIEREFRSTRNGAETYYRISSTPISSKDGETLFVVETMEDITARRNAESAIERYSFQLEERVNSRTHDLREKEKTLSVLVNTVHEIRGASNIAESAEKILQGYANLDAQCAIFALIDKDSMYIADIYPRDRLEDFKNLFGYDLIGIKIHPKRYADNPFSKTASTGKPLFYRGVEGIADFFAECRLTRAPEKNHMAAEVFQGSSLIILPLKTSKTVNGAIAVFAKTSLLESNYEYYDFLANSAAVELGRQKNSESLIKSKVRYRALVENSRDMIILCDRDGNIGYSNPTFSVKTGYSPHRASSMKIYTLFQRSDRKKLMDAVENLLCGGAFPDLIEAKMKVSGPGELWAEMSVSLQPDGSSFQIVARDITARKRMESLIGDLTEFQEKIIQNEYIGIITMDLSRKITSINRGGSNITGHTMADMLHRPLSEIIGPGEMKSPPVFLDITGEAIGTSHQVSLEIPFRRRDGTTATVMYRESVLRDERNRPSALIGFFFDITEKARLEKSSKDLQRRLNQAQLITILSLAKLTEYRDIETGAHLDKIMKYTEILAREMSSFGDYREYITEEYITDLVNSCPLHDIGKVAIPDSILQKRGRLTPEEFEVMKKHSVIGGSTIEEAESRVRGRSYLNIGKEIAYYHHERWDGSGYPEGRKGIEIPLSARIVAVADVYDALTSKRPYKEAYPHDRACRIIADGAGSQFDAQVVRAFINRADSFRDTKRSFTPDLFQEDPEM